MNQTPLGGFAQPSSYPSPDPAAYAPGAPFYNPPAAPGVQLAPGQTSPYQMPIAPQGGDGLLKGLSAANAGFQAGSNSTLPTTDALEAAVQVGGATLSGAAAGTAIAPGVGTAVGAGVGLVMGGLNAWLGVRAARREARARARIQQEAQRRQDARDKQARADALGQLNYNRRQAAIQAQWGSLEMGKNKLYELLNLDQDLKGQLLKRGL